MELGEITKKLSAVKAKGWRVGLAEVILNPENRRCWIETGSAA